jgi:hypothetical protein
MTTKPLATLPILSQSLTTDYLFLNRGNLNYRLPLSSLSSGGSSSPATNIAFGTVKTDSLSADPIVYLKTTVDTLLVNKANTSVLSNYVLTATLASYVTSAALTSTLTSYPTSAGLTTILTGYPTNSQLSTALVPYALTSSLPVVASTGTRGLVKTNSTVADPLVYLKSETDNLLSAKADISAMASTYATQVALATTNTNITNNYVLTTTLASYVTSAALTTTLTSYPTNGQLTTTLASYALTSALAGVASNSVRGLVKTNTTNADPVVYLKSETDGLLVNKVDTADSRLTNSRTPTGTASGALSGNYPSPTMALSHIMHPGYTPGQYYCSGIGATSGTPALVANTVYAAPFYIYHNIGVDQLAFEVTTANASTLVTVAFYTSINNSPDALVFTSGDVSIATTGAKVATVSGTLSRGWYWAVMVANGTGNVRGVGANVLTSGFNGQPTPTSTFGCGFSQALTYAAMPATFPTGTRTIITSSYPLIFIRDV